MAASKKASGAALKRVVPTLKKHDLEQLEETLAERRASLAEANDRIARINTELEVATAESRQRLAEIQAEIDDANAQRESMLSATLVTMHATKIYDWMIALPGQRCVIVSLIDGAIDLSFMDEEGEPIPGPEQPQPPSEGILVGEDPAHPLVIEFEEVDELDATPGPQSHE